MQAHRKKALPVCFEACQCAVGKVVWRVLDFAFATPICRLFPDSFRFVRLCTTCSCTIFTFCGLSYRSVLRPSLEHYRVVLIPTLHFFAFHTLDFLSELLLFTPGLSWGENPPPSLACLLVSRQNYPGLVLGCVHVDIFTYSCSIFLLVAWSSSTGA